MGRLEETLHELALIAGFFMAGYGLHQIYPPVAWIVCGLLLFFFGFRAIIGKGE